MGNENNNLGFIGAGKMANAIMKGIIGSNFLPVDSIYIYDKNQDTLKFTSKNLKVQAVETLDELLEKCPTIMIATKPFVINEILEAIHDKIRNHLIISILAGVSTEKIEAKLGKTRIIRVMPNTPALVQEGMSAVCKGKYAFDNDAEFVLNMFSKLGRAIQTDEKYIGFFMNMRGLPAPATFDDVPTYILIPAFVINELTVGFEMGVLIFFPFLVIDMVVASTLMAMGMIMLPPVMISLPFKIILFILVDGWSLLTQGLFVSFM